jgi:hypothetical protein
MLGVLRSRVNEDDTPMEAGNGKSHDFGLSQALANQVVRKGVCGVPRFCSLFSPFRPLFSARRNWSTTIPSEPP